MGVKGSAALQNVETVRSVLHSMVIGFCWGWPRQKKKGNAMTVEMVVAVLALLVALAQLWVSLHDKKK